MKARIRTGFFLLVFKLLILTGFARTQELTGVIRLVTNTEGGTGTYFEPYILYSSNVQWRIDESFGTGREQAVYMTEIHLARHRSCATTVMFENLSWAQIQGRIFSWHAATGIYYIKVGIYYQGREYESTIHIHCNVPPVKSFNEPYRPPQGNVPPIPVMKVLNTTGGDGAYSNPYIITNPIVKFMLDGTTDPNGRDDMVYGVCYWAIYTKGYHPVYSSLDEHERDPYKTFLYFQEMQNKVYEWDTRLRPSESNRYDLVLVAMDQYGHFIDKFWWFYYDPNASTSNPILTLSPATLDFTENGTKLFIVNNSGTGRLAWSAAITNGREWITSVTPETGTLDAGAHQEVRVTVNRGQLSDGKYPGNIFIDSNGGDRNLALSFLVNIPPSPPKNVKVTTP
ncbi:hypothetical protein L0128_13720 [candidate division KSB1 bacterium]|nr:hypothetical protein [candidate division KSB1 bacterium]